MTTPDAQTAIAFTQVVWILQWLLALVACVLGLVALFRRRPSLDRELSGMVSHDACARFRAAADARRSEEISSIETRLEDGNRLFRALERSIGRLEGVLDEIQKRLK
jgi:E3 ubiquitin-protein ligase DOA10